MFKQLFKAIAEVFSSWRNSIYLWRKKYKGYLADAAR